MLPTCGRASLRIPANSNGRSAWPTSFCGRATLTKLSSCCAKSTRPPAPLPPARYLEAGGFLLMRELFRQALDLLDGASRLLPDARELFLAKAITLELLNRREDERKLLDQIQERWREWARAWVLKGILLE